MLKLEQGKIYIQRREKLIILECMPNALFAEECGEDNILNIYLLMEKLLKLNLKTMIVFMGDNLLVLTAIGTVLRKKKNSLGIFNKIIKNIK